MLLPSLDPRPRDWFRRAHDGTSSVLQRAAHWARLDSSQLASAGVLSRGKVELAAHTPLEQLHLLTVEIWTRGMESFATPPVIPAAAREAEDELKPEEEEAVEGGLALTVGGVRRPDVTLFNGQGELLGHIWSGAGSAPTPVLRAVLPRAHAARRYALQAGAVLRATGRRALALAQDAQVTGSAPTPVLRAVLPRAHAARRYALQAGAVLRATGRRALALAQDAQVTGSAPTPVLRAVLPRAHAARRYALQAGAVLRATGRRALALAQDAQVTGSAPTPVLRAVLPRAHAARRYALQAGAVLRATGRRALALAQDAQAQVSLWGRTARAGLALRGAGVETWTLRLRTKWGDVTARAHAEIEPELTIAAALDFYDKPQLCVHTAVPDYTYSRNVTLESVLGAGLLRVRRARVTSRRAPGRTLALGAPNDAACAALGADHRE
ncbi:uncharacterized protein LOC134672847 [Cydia fagiglandana]|uniref:uncharacterized protein LOC134672847 n=1 Tax=Cydia fagiglandana TaxID=1458189 RepID=UPI002FEE2BAE